MGATLGLSITKKMEEINDFPSHLIVSGNSGPGVKESYEKQQKGKRYLMKDEDFKEELRELGGVPEEILENDELYHFFSPIMRADFEVLEKDNYSEEGLIIKTPIYALMGTKEEQCHEIDNWKRFTSGEFQFQILDGDHFFINDHPEQIAGIIKKTLLIIRL